MYNITVKYGIDDLPRQVAPGTTIRKVVQDANVKSILGYSDNVRVLINGVAQPLTAEVPDGAVLELETAANEKAQD